MNFIRRSSAEKARKNRARAARKPKVRWEVLGLPQETKTTPSMDDIRQQVSHLANSWLEQGTPLTHGRPQSAFGSHGVRNRK